tara:strand:- start:341 stop:535 length:195 start_codon:yes stop_codon:yes gene_type:complete
MYNVFHRLSSKELEEAVIEYLVRTQRHDLVTRMINNEPHFSLTREGDLLCQALVAPAKTPEENK